MLDFIGFFDNLCAENGLFCVQSGHTENINRKSILLILFVLCLVHIISLLTQ